MSLIRGLLIAIVFSAPLWLLILVCVKWPAPAAVIIGVGFAAFCFRKAWKSGK